MSKRRSYPGHIERRPGGDYRVVLTVGSDRFKYQLPGVTLAEAREFAREEHRRLQRMIERGLPVRMRMSQLLDEWEESHFPEIRERSRVGYELALDGFREFFVRLKQMRDPLVYMVRARHVRLYLDWRKFHTRRNGCWVKTSEPMSARTVEKDRAILHNVFQQAVADETIEANPVAKSKKPEVDRRPAVLLSDAQAARLLAECRDRPRTPMLYAYVVLLLESGARGQSEVLHMRRDDVDLDEGWVTIRSSYRHKNKTAKTRVVPMTPLVQRTLQEHERRFRNVAYAGRRSPWVFHHTRNQGKAKAGDRLQSMDALKKAARRAELPEDWVPHDLRHLRITTWIEAGQDVSLVRDAVGHADISTTNYYTHVRRKHLAPLADHGLESRMREDEPAEDELSQGTRTGT